MAAPKNPDDLPDLETLLRKLVEAGELTHLSICPVAGDGPGGAVWSVSYSPASQWGSGFGRHADIVTAIKLAVLDKRLVKFTRKRKAETGDPEIPDIPETAEELPDFLA